MARTLLPCLLALLLAGRASAELVVNPGFETGDFSGWDVTSDVPPPATEVENEPASHSGSFDVYFAQAGGFDRLTQDLLTNNGESYDLTFWLAGDPGGSPDEEDVQQFQVWWGGTMLLDRTDTDAFPYEQITFTNLLATSGSPPSCSWGVTIPARITWMMFP